MISYGIKELATKTGNPGPWIITGELLLERGVPVSAILKGSRRYWPIRGLARP